MEKKFESFIWNQNTVELQKAVKYLGLILDQNDTFNQQIEKKIKIAIEPFQIFIKQDGFSAHLFSLEHTCS